MKTIKNITYFLDGIKRNIKIPYLYRKIKIDETINLSDALSLNEFINLKKSKLR